MIDIIYIYQTKDKEYFALSNSFLLLEDYLSKKKSISLNIDFINHFLVSWLCSPSIYETMIKEITKIPSNSFITINIQTKSLKLYYIDYGENSISLESEEGQEIIDKWVDKWGYIIRSLKKQTDNISFDLTGGFDTRLILSIFLNSGINLTDIMIKSDNDKKHCHEEDFMIATNISSKFGFKLNNHSLDDNATLWSIKDTLYCTMYSKLGFHKEFYLKDKFFHKPRFAFTGGGQIRGFPGLPIKEYIEQISSQKKFLGKQFYKSSVRLCNRSVNLLKKRKTYYNDYDISSDLYSKGRAVNHYGKGALEGFLANIYPIQILRDPIIKKIKYDINNNSPHDLIAYIYIRFAYDLINFPIEGNRTLNLESIKKAEKLNKCRNKYKIKLDYNQNFYIDIRRKSPVPASNETTDIILYLNGIFESSKFIRSINKIYDIKIYKWAKSYNSTFFPFRYLYGLLSIVTTIDYVSLNKEYMKKLKNKILLNKKKNNKILNG